MGDATFLKDDFVNPVQPIKTPARTQDEVMREMRHELLRLRTAEKKWLEGQDTLAQALARYAAENEHLKKQVQSLQDHSDVQLMEIRRLKGELASANAQRMAVYELSNLQRMRGIAG